MIKALVTDIEGTTSSLSFVKDVLFPYARRRLPAFVVTHADTPEVQHWLHEAAREAGLVSAGQQEMIDLLIGWIDEDRKATPLKALQGMIWDEGYRSGEFRGHVYPEVAAALREWHARGVALYVYSSGSVAAQKLLFGFSDAGDLTGLFSGYFDTEIGAKRYPASYRRIAESLAMTPSDILFLSDVVAELDAARAAGMRTTLLARGADGCPGGGQHHCATDFTAISLDG